MKWNGIVIAALAAGAIALGADAQDKPASPAPGTPPHEHVGSSKVAGVPGGSMGGMLAEDKTMMSHRQKLMADMDAADARLAGLVARMNAVEGDRKVDAMESVIGELVAQRKQMREGMMAMGPEMMGHMMAHMKSETVGGMKKSMAMCPMMKHSGMAEPGDKDHAGHHPDTKK